ncbi:hypothetical protein GCM10009839_06680 [Catenulispora yoronensis]|uniref:Oxidoreductase molybdopterin-binding domain-containing protein n=1 Tax=Catenulispora yoronensis TaxID=450799 RepID=A0ABN2TMP2_9ACTN
MSPSSTAVRLHGHLHHPHEVTVEQLRALPVHRVQVSFDCRSSGPQHHSFEGPTLWDVLQTAGPHLNGAHRKSRLGHLITITGTDGHFTLLSWAEIDPEFSGQQVLLATSIDARPLDAAGPQLVVPTDVCGARYISGITTVWTGPLDAWQPTDLGLHQSPYAYGVADSRPNAASSALPASA